MSMIVPYNSDGRHRIAVRKGASVTITFRKNLMIVKAKEPDDIILIYVEAEEYQTPEGYQEIEIRRIAGK